MRNFVRAVVAVGILGGISMGAVGASDAAVGRTFASGKYELALDGVNAGFATAIAGGSAYSDVVTEKVGADHIARKHIAGVKYEDITLNAGTGMSPAFYNWVKESFSPKHSRKNGSVIVMDYDGKQSSALNFFNGLVTEIGMPALDGASKDPARIHVTFAPEYTRRIAGNGGVVASHETHQNAKKWLANGFRLKIDNLDVTRVSKIEALTIRQSVSANPVGEQRDYQKEPGNLEVPNLVITFPEAYAKAFYDWHEDFIIKGNNGQDKEKNGSLEYLSPSGGTYFTLTFKNIGISRLETVDPGAGAEGVRKVKATLYVEQMSFDYTKESTF